VHRAFLEARANPTAGGFLGPPLGYLRASSQAATQDGDDQLRLAATAVICALALQAPGAAWADPLLTYPLKIKGHLIRVEVANTEDARRIGLMFRDALGENQGMLFVYETQGRHAMWMKNTLIPLSVAFIDRSGRIINIEDMQPQTEDAHGARADAAFSLETNQGWFKKRAIKAGDRVQGLERVPPSLE
jgi:hypothetical protein